jgi:hypothetical protein
MSEYGSAATGCLEKIWNRTRLPSIYQECEKKAFNSVASCMEAPYWQLAIVYLVCICQFVDFQAIF